MLSAVLEAGEEGAGEVSGTAVGHGVCVTGAVVRVMREGRVRRERRGDFEDMNYYFVHGYIHRPHTNDPFSGVWEVEETITPAQVCDVLKEKIAKTSGVQTVAIEFDVFQRVE